jgi:hypothetical protein
MASFAQVRIIEQQIMRYDPVFTYEIVSERNEYSRADVEYLEGQLAARQSAVQTRVDSLYRELPEGIARDRTTLSITRAMNPSSGEVVDFLTTNASSRYQRQVEGMASREGMIYIRGFGNSHAEEIGVYGAQERGLVPLVSHTSRPHCLAACFPMLLENNVLPGSSPVPFSFIGGPAR